MISNLQAIVALCAGAGFLIVWLAFPPKRVRTMFETGDQHSSTAEGSNCPPPEDQPETESADEEALKAQSTYSGSRPRWCDILLLEPDAKPAAIRKAYARLMKGLHPDITGSDEHTSRRCALVQEAYQQAMKNCRARA